MIQPDREYSGGETEMRILCKMLDYLGATFDHIGAHATHARLVCVILKTWQEFKSGSGPKVTRHSHHQG